VGPIRKWFFLYKRFPKSSLSAENIAGKGGKIWKIPWTSENQFEKLFIIATSSKSPQILNYSKYSKSRLV
jgi:hypothetical protein